MPSDLIYDPFVGSGTTIIVAEITGRVCYSVEIDPAYSAIALIARWQERTGKRAIKKRREPLGLLSSRGVHRGFTGVTQDRDADCSTVCADTRETKSHRLQRVLRQPDLNGAILAAIQRIHSTSKIIAGPTYELEKRSHFSHYV